MNRFICTSTTTEFSFARKIFNLFIQFIDDFKFILVWPFGAVQFVVYSIKSPILHTLFYKPILCEHWSKGFGYWET